MQLRHMLLFSGSSGTAPYTFTYNINGGTNQTVTTVVGNSISVPVTTVVPGTFTYTLLSVRMAHPHRVHSHRAEVW